jgi:AraC family transcriptional regulator of arabinose operon
MLENTDDSIAEITFRCGFLDPAAFNRHFKNKTGVMPSKYRDMHKSQKKESVEQI